jgi:hypothetical protein
LIQLLLSLVYFQYLETHVLSVVLSHHRAVFIQSLSAFECLNQSSRNLVCMSLHLYLHFSIVERQRSVKRCRGNEYTRNNRRIMKNVFWDVMPRGSCKNRRFGGMCLLHHQSRKEQRARNKANINVQLKHAAKNIRNVVAAMKTSNLT